MSNYSISNQEYSDEEERVEKELEHYRRRLEKMNENQKDKPSAEVRW